MWVPSEFRHFHLLLSSSAKAHSIRFFFLVTAHYFYQAGRRTMCELNEKRHWMFAWLVFIHKYADDSFGNLNFVDFLPLSLWVFHALSVIFFLKSIYRKTFCDYFMRWLELFKLLHNTKSNKCSGLLAIFLHRKYPQRNNNFHAVFK